MNYQPLRTVDRKYFYLNQPLRILIAIIFFASFSFFSKAQSCYQPLSGSNINIGIVEGSGLCITQLCLGAQNNNLQNIINANSEDYYEFNSLLSLLNVSGVGVRNSTPNYNYPINTYLGFKIGVGSNSLLDVNLLGNYYMATFKDGSNTPEEVFGLWNLLQTSALMPGQKIAYITAKATKEFDEVRFYSTNLANVQANLRIYHAYAFEGACNLMNNTYCEQMIQGNHAKVMYNGSLLTVGGNLVNPENISNGYKLDYAVLKTPANVAGSVFVSVLDTKHTMQGGRRAGFIIEPETSNEILNANALGAITISTYLHGQLQESYVAYNQSSQAVLDLSVFSTTGGGKIKVAFTTSASKNFNEVRITVGSLINAGLTGGLRVYGAFTEPATCGECTKYFNTSTNAQATVVSSSGFNSTSNLLNANVNDYAGGVGGLLQPTSGTIKVGTTNNQTVNPGAYVGFELSDGSTLLNLGLFNALKVKTYLGNNLVEEISSSGLVGATLLSTVNKSIVGFKSNFAFDSWELVVDGGLLALNLGTGWRVFNPILIKDTDNDGIADCNDFSSSCNDAYDNDGNGIPDGCDQADMLTKIELVTNVTHFKPGDSLVFKITLKNNGPQNAQNVSIFNQAPSQTQNTSWTATVTGTGLTLPASSGSGSIDHSFALFPNGVEVTYMVTVATNATYNLPYLTNTIAASSHTEDPDPNCTQCSTPNLPMHPHPDLKSSAFVLSSSFQYPSNLIKNIGFHIQEINGSATDSIITLVIPKNANYTITFNNTITTFSGYTMDNTNWVLTSDANNYYVSSNGNTNVAANGYKSIVVQFTYNTNNTLTEHSRINYYINANSGRERNIINNNQIIDFKLN